MGRNVQSFAVDATIAAQRFVALTGTANTVGYPENNQRLPAGITIDTVKDATQAIPVALSGEIAKLLFNDTVAAGALVSSDSSGRGIPFSLADTTTALTLASAYGGILVDSAVALTATIAKVLIRPGYDRE